MRLLRLVATPIVVGSLVTFVVACSSDSSPAGGGADASARDASGPAPCTGADGSCCPDPSAVFTGGTCDSDLGGTFCPDKCGVTHECNGVNWSSDQAGTSTCATDGGAGDASAPETGSEGAPDAPDDALVDALAD